MQDRRLEAREARALLRALRDLNLGAARIELSPTERVEVEGCLSLDAPVERGVRYLLRREDGRGEVLAISLEEDRLSMRLEPADEPCAAPRRVSSVRLTADPFGRLTIPGLGARLDLHRPTPRELERFLRRLVRATARSEAA